MAIQGSRCCVKPLTDICSVVLDCSNARPNASHAVVQATHPAAQVWRVSAQAASGVLDTSVPRSTPGALGATGARASLALLEATT